MRGAIAGLLVVVGLLSAPLSALALSAEPLVQFQIGDESIEISVGDLFIARRMTDGVAFRMPKQHRAWLARTTDANIDGRFLVTLDGELLADGIVRTPISDGWFNLTGPEARTLADAADRATEAD